MKYVALTWQILIQFCISKSACICKSQIIRKISLTFCCRKNHEDAWLHGIFQIQYFTDFDRAKLKHFVEKSKFQTKRDYLKSI